MDIKELFDNREEYLGKEVTLNGWVRNHRKQKSMGFIDFYDGTIFNLLQVVYDASNADVQAAASKLKIGSCARVTGKAVLNQNNGSVEIELSSAETLGECAEDYPLQPKKHSLEFLREHAYLRPRTRLFQAVFKIRSVASMAIHEYFQNNGYVYVHTPLFTANDAEGAGNTITVTTFDPVDGKKKDYADDFFGKHASLAVTGQLEGETFAMAFGKIYTFGPTFRAENS
ncbi:MAG: asparagine--tRNA ligase, partial [Clostridia bacterium]|nr:asparagine--tRNA ligase [Clostridia bacterium]